jgi:hypothetical protein
MKKRTDLEIAMRKYVVKGNTACREALLKLVKTDKNMGKHNAKYEHIAKQFDPRTD